MPEAAPPSLTLTEIRRLDDPLLLPWLALYETAFPREERNLVADILAAVVAAAPPDQGEHLLAAADGDGRFAGLAFYSLQPGADGPTAGLFYLATPPERRSQGIGAWLYREVRCRTAAAGARALFLEVEIPERAADEAAAALAARRIAFYRRLGCRRLAGISYLQYVGAHVAPIPMHVLVDAAPARAADEVLALARQHFGRWLTPAGKPALE